MSHCYAPIAANWSFTVRSLPLFALVALSDRYCYCYIHVFLLSSLSITYHTNVPAVHLELKDARKVLPAIRIVQGSIVRAMRLCQSPVRLKYWLPSWIEIHVELQICLYSCSTYNSCRLRYASLTTFTIRPSFCRVKINSRTSILLVSNADQFYFLVSNADQFYFCLRSNTPTIEVELLL